MEHLRTFSKNWIGVCLLLLAISLEGVLAGITCVVCTGQASESDCNTQGSTKCAPAENRCKSEYTDDFTTWSKQCSSSSSCVDGCVSGTCTACCNGNNCNTVADIISPSSTSPEPSTVSTYVSSSVESSISSSLESDASSTPVLSVSDTLQSAVSSTPDLTISSTIAVSSTLRVPLSSTISASASLVSYASVSASVSSTISAPVVDLALSTGEQMAFLYIIFILVAPVLISAIAAGCWLAYFRRRKRNKEKKEAYDKVREKNTTKKGGSKVKAERRKNVV